MTEEGNNFVKRIGAGIVAALTTVATVTPLTSKLLNQELLVSFPTKISRERLYEPRVGSLLEEGLHISPVGNLLEEGLHISPVGNLLEEGLHISPVGNLLVQKAVPFKPINVKPINVKPILLPFVVPIANSLYEAGQKVSEILGEAVKKVSKLFGLINNPPPVTCFNNRPGGELDNSSVDNSSGGETNTPYTEYKAKLCLIIKDNVKEKLKAEIDKEDKSLKSKYQNLEDPVAKKLLIKRAHEELIRNESLRLTQQENKEHGNKFSPTEVIFMATSVATTVLVLDSRTTEKG